MTNEEAIKILEIAKAETEWTAPLDYQEAFDMAIDALNQQVPMKPKVKEGEFGYCLYYACPKCNYYFGTKGKRSIILFDKRKYCECGQAIDWSDDK